MQVSLCIDCDNNLTRILICPVLSILHAVSVHFFQIFYFYSTINGRSMTAWNLEEVIPLPYAPPRPSLHSLKFRPPPPFPLLSQLRKEHWSLLLVQSWCRCRTWADHIGPPERFPVLALPCNTKQTSPSALVFLAVKPKLFPHSPKTVLERQSAWSS